jgi:REP element-mobilizing transposase RayT
MQKLPEIKIPLAYHLTWGTHGARLHGSERPHVDNEHNEFGTPFPPADAEREDAARRRLIGDPVSLTLEQRKEVEAAIHDLAQRYHWAVHAIAIQADHGHVVITAPRVGNELRDALKAVASKCLNRKFARKTWWAEGGSAKYIWTEEYLGSAAKYVRDQRDF